METYIIVMEYNTTVFNPKLGLLACGWSQNSKNVKYMLCSFLIH